MPVGGWTRRADVDEKESHYDDAVDDDDEEEEEDWADNDESSDVD